VQNVKKYATLGIVVLKFVYANVIIVVHVLTFYRKKLVNQLIKMIGDQLCLAIYVIQKYYTNMQDDWRSIMSCNLCNSEILYKHAMSQRREIKKIIDNYVDFDGPDGKEQRDQFLHDIFLYVKSQSK
jgi:hypothetical protein